MCNFWDVRFRNAFRTSLKASPCPLSSSLQLRPAKCEDLGMESREEGSLVETGLHSDGSVNFSKESAEELPSEFICLPCFEQGNSFASDLLAVRHKAYFFNDFFV